MSRIRAGRKLQLEFKNFYSHFPFVTVVCEKGTKTDDRRQQLAQPVPVDVTQPLIIPVFFWIKTFYCRVLNVGAGGVLPQTPRESE